MSLSTAISSAVNSAFVAVGDLKKDVTVVSYAQGNQIRNQTTGQVEFSSSTTYTGEIIVVEFTSKEDRANVESGDLRGIMKKSEILRLQASDIVTFDNIDHRVISIAPDPSENIWDCQLRRNK